MKTKNILAIFCCMAMFGCQNNDPQQGGLSNLYEGIGAIVDSKILPDGSQLMTDSKGNTITKDKDGNTTILTSQGDTIYIDNSINENSTALQDKWYNSIWQTNQNSPDSPHPGEPEPTEPEWIRIAQEYGFQIDKQEVKSDTTIIEREQNISYRGHFRKTTVSLQQTNTTMQYTYTKTRTYTKYTVTPGKTGEGNFQFELNIEGARVTIFQHEYEYNYQTEDYEYVNSVILAEGSVNPVDNSYLLFRGAETTSSKDEQIGTSRKTTYYNYRRLNDTQIVVSNNSGQYMLKESDSGSSNTPTMDVYEMGGSYCLIHLELVSYK